MVDQIDANTVKNEVQDVKTNSSSRLDLLGDLENSNKLLFEWIEDTEGKMKKDVGFLNDLGKSEPILKNIEPLRKTLTATNQQQQSLRQK